MQARECPFCNNEIPYYTEFCAYCGSVSTPSRHEMQVCRSCDNSTPYDREYSAYCGKRVMVRKMQTLKTVDMPATTENTKDWCQD
jgi:predicted amidophosphoribosyltransferase